jgi:hypothetical protein
MPPIEEEYPRPVLAEWAELTAILRSQLHAVSDNFVECKDINELRPRIRATLCS